MNELEKLMWAYVIGTILGYLIIIYFILSVIF